MLRNALLLPIAMLPLLGGHGHAASYEPSRIKPPAIPREFRGLWIATVANIDWPSKPGLTPAAQRTELAHILDKAAALNFNAVIFQVRPACDAFYPSKLEPWSEYLTGAMGQAPEPMYDPLAFAIEEAHKRGLELHAWFNPYRALHKSHEGRVAPNHISKTHPTLAKRHGQYLWLDPGEPQVQEHSLAVVMDVVRRYDIDAVHFDDYFYPDPAESPQPFPDQGSWQRYGGGKIPLQDWRRENVDSFIEKVHRSVKSAKPWVKFGISPHGIWRPGHPPQIRGSDNFEKLNADSRKWLQKGWLDYFSPQLYWTIGSREQSFPILLDWWKEQNVKRRHLWPGMSAAFALSSGWTPDEIPNQIQHTRQRPEVSGYVLYSASKVLANEPLMNRMVRDTQRQKTLVPASPWLIPTPPAKPSASITGTPTTLKLSWKPGATNQVVRWWVVQRRVSNEWKLDLFPAEQRTMNLGTAPEVVSVTAVDRVGNGGAPVVLQLKKAVAPRNPANRK